MTHPRIAVVGIGGIFPQSPTLDEFWGHVRAGRSAARPVPPGRWLLRPEDAFSARGGTPDHVDSVQGCFVDDLPCDVTGLDLDPLLLARLDPAFRLVLHAGRQAWRDAVTAAVDPTRVGVIVGNIVLPTERASELAREILGATFEEQILGSARMPRIEPLSRHVAGLPGGVLAKALGLGGGSYTLDAACASSLYALKLAADELVAGRADAMLTGGLSRPDCLYTQMGFSQLRALSSSGRCAPFDAGADGLVVGEGAGIVVLKRLDDALRHGDHVYAVIAGIGLSNDVEGKLLAPSTEGQLRAMRDAYRRSGWKPSDVDLIECHGTGTPTGDAVEFASLRALWGKGPWRAGQCVIGSVKSNVGHTLTAAGSAGLLKVLLAFRERVLPPTANFTAPAAGLDYAGGPFRVLPTSQPWETRAKDEPRRAALSAFGFGGINAHVLLEEWSPVGQVANLPPVGQVANLPPVGQVANLPDPQDLQNTERETRGVLEDLPTRARQVGNLPHDAPVRQVGNLPHDAPVRQVGNLPHDAPVRQVGNLPHDVAQEVAVVGMGAYFGKWRGLRAFQERVLGSKDTIEPAPPRHCFGADRAEWLRSIPKAAAALRGYFIDELSVALDRFRIPPRELEEMLPQQLLMLEVAAEALADAAGGAAPSASQPLRLNTGIFIGIELDPGTTNFQVRWSLLNKAREWNEQQHLGLSPAEVEAWVDSLRQAAGPALSANRTMGALGGVVASRLAREFHVGGPSFTISAEEASGLSAVQAAVRMLQQGEIDQALVGAVDLASDVRTLLAAQDRAAIPGEGAAAVVLKRLDDARRDGDHVYAVIRGIGSACGGNLESDVPAVSSYSAALQRAYADAGVEPTSTSYVEMHAGGATLEDADEAAALDEFFHQAGRTVPCAVGSVKGDVGHAGAASGLASFVKACLCLHQAILPPLRAPSGSIPDLLELSRFRRLAGPQFWLHDRADGPRRAGVSACGRGSNCVHVVLEEAPGTRDRPRPRRPAGASPEVLLAIEADDVPGLREGLQRLGRLAGRRPALLALAREWHAGRNTASPRCVALLAREPQELERLCGIADDWLLDRPDENPLATRDPSLERIFYAPEWVGTEAKVAFVFPGSGNHFAGMGRRLSAAWPEVLRRQDEENQRLRSQFLPDLFWNGLSHSIEDHRALIFGQVALGTLVSDVLQSLGVRPNAVIGYSLGETAGLFALRAWTDRDAMLERTLASDLFSTELAGPCRAARRAWNLAEGEAVDWLAGAVDVPAEAVREKLGSGVAAERVEDPHAEREAYDTTRVYLLIVNTPRGAVVGGARPAVEALVRELGCRFWPLSGVSTVHCEIVREVEEAYRKLHLLPTTPPPGVDFYSGASGKRYDVTTESAAASILAQALHGLDFAALIRQAYGDGVRAFVEIGPGNSCTRMVGQILEGQLHLARPACVAGQDEVATILRLLGHLVAVRVRVDLAKLHEDAEPAPVTSGGRTLLLPVGGDAFVVPPRPGRPLVGAPAAEDASEKSLPYPGTQETAARDDGAVVPITIPSPQPLSPDQKLEQPSGPPPAIVVEPSPALIDPLLAQMTAAVAARADAHAAYLRFSERLAECLSQAPATVGVTLRVTDPHAEREAYDADPHAERGAYDADPHAEREAYDADPHAESEAYDTPPATDPHAEREAYGPALDRGRCLEFAVGQIGRVLGAGFAEADTFPTRVRLPDEPLMLVDRILTIQGEPHSLTGGQVVTEHDVHAGAWYLDGGRIPTCIAVEAGQADLFLSGYLGIDFRTRGLAVYRLLDAVVVFHRGLPGPSEVIRYDIRIDHFFRQGETYLFRFRFEGTVNGAPLLSMKDGCAGFFTAAELAAGRGVVQTELDRRPRAGVRPPNWQELVSQEVTSYDDDQVEALRRGDLAGCFGPRFAALRLRAPTRLPGGRMRLVHRVVRLDPEGGRFGLGQIRAEADVRPDDWYLTCHFVDDRVMPGTLTYECCLHTLRILLMRMGWVGEQDEVVCEPVPEVASRLKCRGQIIETTRTVRYDVTLKEFGYRPEPYAIADALIYADDRPIVEITDMSLRMSGLTRDTVEALWRRSGPEASQESFRVPASDVHPASRAPDPLPGTSKRPLFDRSHVLAFAVGKPSEAFGERYRVFDEERVIARLPGEPFCFIDRVVACTARPWIMEAGGTVEVDYDVPEDAWYFQANRLEEMPFAILLETALQPCGWLAAYVGSPLTSPHDLHFRNLGGKAVQRAPVSRHVGTLSTVVRMTKVSQSAGMIIQNYEFSIRAGTREVYAGDTYFGYFTRAALAQQIGVRDANPHRPGEAELARGRTLPFPVGPSLPAPPFRMIDNVDVLVLDGGPRGLGFIQGSKDVDAAEWFFKAHFHQDPVWPGSLGLEAFLQLLKVYAVERWGRGSLAVPRAETEHRWLYRGQVVPKDRKVTVLAWITAIDDVRHHLAADGVLAVDERIIYQMNDFTLGPS